VEYISESELCYNIYLLQLFVHPAAVVGRSVDVCLALLLQHLFRLGPRVFILCFKNCQQELQFFQRSNNLRYFRDIDSQKLYSLPPHMFARLSF